MILVLAGFLLISDTIESAATDMKNIWSPYCKGISLLECPSSQAEELRNEVYERIRNGENFKKIYVDLQSRYGEGVLRMSPDSSGREGLSYWIPWVLIFAAALFVGLFWKFRPRKVRATPRKAVPVDKMMTERIERDLKDRMNS